MIRRIIYLENLSNYGMMAPWYGIISFWRNKNNIFLQYNGKPFPRSKTKTKKNMISPTSLSIYDAGIPNNATIFASRRRRGGCFIVSISIFLSIFILFLLSGVTCGLSLFMVPFMVPLLFILPVFCL